MAENKITFSLGSVFSGQGFSKADAALAKTAKNAANAGNAFSKMKSSLANAGKSIIRNLANVQAGFQMISSVAGKFGSAIRSAFRFETQTVQFKTLIGDIDDARAHMQMLKELGDTPPFGLDEFAKASRSLMVMSDGVLGYKSSLKLCGDAAAATGNSLDAISHAVGMAYANIRDGEPIGRAATQLKNMGVLTPEVVRQLEDMEKAGASGAETWEKLEGALKKYNGAMADTEKTGEGLVGAIKSRWDNIVRQFGSAMTKDAKEGLEGVLSAAKDLEKSRAVEDWGRRASGVLSEVMDVAKPLISVINGLGSAFDRTRGFFRKVGSAAGAAVGHVAGETDLEMANDASIWKAMKDAWNDEGLNQRNAMAQLYEVGGKEYTQEEFDKAFGKPFENAVDAAAKKEADEKARIAAQLAEADRKRAEKAAAEQRKRDEKLHAERMKQLEKEAEEEEKARQKEARATAVAEIRTDAGENEDMAREEARHRIAAANENIRGIDAQIAQRNAQASRVQRGIDADHKLHRGIGGEGYNKYSYDEDGKLNDRRQFDRANRYADKQDRLNERRTPNSDKRDEERAARLEQRDADIKAGKKSYMGDADRKWLDNYRKYKQYREGTAELEKRRKEEEDKIAAAEAQLKEDVKMIREKMEQAIKTLEVQ